MLCSHFICASRKARINLDVIISLLVVYYSIRGTRNCKKHRDHQRYALEAKTQLLKHWPTVSFNAAVLNIPEQVY